MKNRIWMGMALVALQVLWTGTAQSRVWLKPKGSDAMPLRAKALSAEVVIEKQFATTRNVMTFQNETSQRIEADFFYTVPDDSVVTYFAYWYQDEKVVARVVEKERAAAIYKHITSRMRDPALVEMIGRNTFRARIFPIEPNADLRIEMHFAQVLKSESRGAVYTFPLAPEEAGKGTLEKLDVRVQVKRDAALTGVWNNYKLPVASDGSGYAMKLSQLNYRAPKDFEIHLQRKAAPLRAALYAAPSGGRDGFFALAITPNRAFAKSSLQIQGIQTFDVVPAKLPRLKAGQSTLVCGRYRGSGAATISLRDGNQSTLSAPVSFGSAPQNNNVATKLWASRRIEMLSGNAKNRNAVMTLSKRFTLPSKWTSWLAVPTAELIRFKQEKIQADLSIVGRRYALEVANGRASGRTARALKTQFAGLAKQVESYYGTTEINTYVGWTMRELHSTLRAQSYAEKPNGRLQSTLRRQIKRLQSVLGKDGDVPSYIIEDDMRVASRAYMDAVLKNGQKSRRAQRAKSDLQALSRSARNNGWSWNTFVDEALNVRGRRQAELVVSEKFAAKPDTRRLASLQKQLKTLDKVRAGTSQQFLRAAFDAEVRPKMSDLASRVIDAKFAATPDSQRADVAQRELDRIAKLSGVSASSFLESARSNWAQRALEPALQQRLEEEYAAQPDEKKLAQWQREIERIQKVGRVSTQQSDRTVAYRLTDIQERLRAEYVAELKQPKPNRARLTELETRMTNVYRDPQYKGMENYYYNPVPERVDEPLKLPKITQLKTELEEIDAEKSKAPPARLAQLDQKRAETVDKLDYATKYFLRLGDPLISIDAPHDAQNVVAVLPGGEVKKLVWNATNRKWEARFDIPSYASEGAYTITVIIVDKAGARRSMDIRYRVDMTAPSGEGRALAVQSTLKAESRKLRLEVAGSEGTTRVFALLPWGDKLELKPSNVAAHRFFALVEVSKEHRGLNGAVTYILTDKAHNRTQITVDVSK